MCIASMETSIQHELISMKDEMCVLHTAVCMSHDSYQSSGQMER